MDFKSVLFTKEHILSPFKMDYNNKEISIQDRKIKTIALSIIVGIFTAGIGGVILFYCLSAKYKVEKLNFNDINPTNKNELNLSETTEKTVLKRKPVSKDQAHINIFVASFLHPYITGQITKETDSKDRKPMIELLHEQMPGFDPSKRGEIEEMALNAFFEKAALGLYVNQKRGARSGDITSTSPEIEILVNALEEAIPREFPDKNISPQELREKASRALNVVNEDRKVAREEAFYLRVREESPDHHNKLKQLQESGKLFLV